MYANPQRCPQLTLIDAQGTRVLSERQDETAAQAVLPASKDPEVTARWTERCLVGSEPVPESLKRQIACCFVATGQVETLEEGLARVASSF
ncbi:putative glycosyl transferase [Pseudescherichia vulneris]|nr:putative glycosyl transferase [Pseudescherichia vulneris]